jgi:Putative zinc-finger
MDRDVHNPNQPCRDRESLLILFAAGEELDPAEQAEVVEHITHCSACAAALEREKDWLRAFASHRAEPDAALLADCRAKLEDALDRDEERSWRKRIASLVPASWISPRPAWSAALLLLLGFSAGIYGPRLLHRSPGRVLQATGESAIDAAAAAGGDSALSALDLHTADVSGINVIPAGGSEPPEVEVQLKAQRPLTVHGTVDDSDVKRVLLYVLRNADRFDPDVRINAVDLLRARNNDPDVRAVLCHAVHTDRNTAVRLKALEALNGAEAHDIIRKTLLDALDDHNPGVRIEAINALQSMAAKGQVASDDHLRSVLRDHMRTDPNTYIRLQSAAVMRDLGPRQTF